MEHERKTTDSQVPITKTAHDEPAYFSRTYILIPIHSLDRCLGELAYDVSLVPQKGDNILAVSSQMIVCGLYEHMLSTYDINHAIPYLWARTLRQDGVKSIVFKSIVWRTLKSN